MKTSTFFLLLVISTQAKAICENYQKHGEPEKICFLKEQRALVNEKCFDKNCEAISFLQAGNPRPESIDRSMGRNPSSQYCKHFGYGVFILRDPRGSQQSFCSFPDGSLVDVGSLSRSLK